MEAQIRQLIPTFAMLDAGALVVESQCEITVHRMAVNIACEVWRAMEEARMDAATGPEFRKSNSAKSFPRADCGYLSAAVHMVSYVIATFQGGKK
jgi:hypothetical protein